jgi:hypothetical protein
MSKQTTLKQSTIGAKLSQAFKTATESLIVGVQAYINSKASMETAIVAMRKTKVKFGKSRATCAMLAFTYDQLGTLKTAKGTALADSTKNDYLNAIKRAVNTGCGLNLNSRRKPKPAGQSQTPKGKDKEKLGDALMTDDIMATDESKPATVKVGAYKSNEDAIAALVASIKTVKTQCTIAQWKAITTLHPNVAKLAD